MITKISYIDENAMDRSVLEEAGSILRSGGLVAFPTETVYGLGANALDEAACAGVYLAKGRPSDNPLIVHVSDPEEVLLYAYEDGRGLLRCLMKEFMPGPLTVVLKKKEMISDRVTGGLDTVAIRCPSHPVARELIRVSGVPVAAPSANRSGRPSPTKAEHVERDMDGRIPMILHGERSALGLESTIVALREDGVKLLRPGFITLEELERVCGKVEVDKAVVTQLAVDESPLAPGMKYRHYAPETELIMVDGEDEAVRSFFAKALTENLGVVCFDEDLAFISEAAPPDRVISFGKRGDSLFQAQGLFSMLRGVDRMGVKKAYVRMPIKDGLGLAVYNRLIKACGYQLISL